MGGDYLGYSHVEQLQFEVCLVLSLSLALSQKLSGIGEVHSAMNTPGRRLKMDEHQKYDRRQPCFLHYDQYGSDQGKESVADWPDPAA